WVGFLDPETVVTAGQDQTVRVWDASTGEERRRVPLPLPPHLVALANDGRRLAVALADFHVLVLGLPSGQEQLTFALPRRLTETGVLFPVKKPAEARRITALTFTADDRGLAL